MKHLATRPLLSAAAAAAGRPAASAASSLRASPPSLLLQARVRAAAPAPTRSPTPLPTLLRTLSSSSVVRSDETQQDGQQQQQPKQGLLRSLLHGSESAKADGLTTSSHSTQVARGKYIHEIVRHSIHASKLAEYRAVIGEYYPKLSAASDRYHAKLIGSWQVAVGELETFYHIWQYDGYAGYDACRADLWPSQLQQEIEAKLAPCLKGRSNWLTQEFAFWPTAKRVNKDKVGSSSSTSSSSSGAPAVAEKDWIFELRTYHLKPGMLLEWETHWRRGLEARRRFVEPVGAWFTQCGQLHTVFHIWAYPSLDERKRTRDAAWQVETWSETVSSTVKLIDSMHAQILYPTEFSPLR